MHGQGTKTVWCNSLGKIIEYEGQWQNGKKHGQGTWNDFYGSKYVGEWKNGLKHGFGNFICKT